MATQKIETVFKAKVVKIEIVTQIFDVIVVMIIEKKVTKKIEIVTQKIEIVTQKIEIVTQKIKMVIQATVIIKIKIMKQIFDVIVVMIIKIGYLKIEIVTQ